MPADQPQTALTIPKEVLVARLPNEVVLLHMVTKRYFSLNATGAVVWAGLEEGLGVDAITTRLTDGFEVDAETAAKEVEALLAQLEERQLIARNAGA